MRRGEIVDAARLWLGTPYHHQASLRGVGCDCLGLVRGVWRELFGDEPEIAPPYAPDWAEAGGDTLATAARRHLVEIAADEFGPGDVVLFRWRAGLPAKHAGIVTVPHLHELNIGHSILSRALLTGMGEAVRTMKARMQRPPVA